MSRQIAPRTVIEALLPFAGGVSLGEIYDAARLAGLADQPVRLALRRMVASGDVEQMGRGRAGILNLTESGRRRLRRDRQSLALAAAQDAGKAPWDGRWQLIAVTTPERDRAVRDALRRDLHELGAVTISTGLYASPHDLAAELPEEVEPYLSIATSFDLSVRGTTDPLAIAETLWPSQPTLAAYTILDRAIRRDEGSDGVHPMVRMLLLADALEQAMRADPLLPIELRRAPWAPSKSRATWADRWEALSEKEEHSLYRGWRPPAAAPIDSSGPPP